MFTSCFSWLVYTDTMGRDIKMIMIILELEIGLLSTLDRFPCGSHFVNNTDIIELVILCLKEARVTYMEFPIFDLQIFLTFVRSTLTRLDSLAQAIILVATAI